GNAEKAGDIFLSAVAGSAAVGLFLFLAPEVVSVGVAAFVVTAAGALSYGVSKYVSESLPPELKETVGDWFVEHFNFNFLSGATSGISEAIDRAMREGI